VRIIAIASVALSLATLPAYSQQQPGQTPWGALPGMKSDKPKAEESNSSVKDDDKAYKSALETIPTKPKQAYDPWHNVRAAPPNNSK
jgi:hypothetical protein